MIAEERNVDILETAMFLYNRYPELKTIYPFWRLLSLVDRHDNGLIYIKEDGKIVGAAVYVMVDDETLNKIEKFVYDVSHPEDVAEILKSKGDNLHFLSVAADNVRVILKGLKLTIKQRNPKTVSWLKPDMTFHKIRGVNLCHL